jgi:hypothetical protein
MRRCGFGSRLPRPESSLTTVSARESWTASVESYVSLGGSGAGTKAVYPDGTRMTFPAQGH